MNIETTKIDVSSFISILKQVLVQYKWYTDGYETDDDIKVFSEHMSFLKEYVSSLSSNFFEIALKKAKSGF